MEYLGHILSGHGIAKGPKVNNVMRMPASGNVSGLRSFLGSVQFYSKFLPNLATLTEPLHHLTKNDTPWIWGAEEKAAFQKLKDLLCADSVLSTSIHLSLSGFLAVPQRWVYELSFFIGTQTAVSALLPMSPRPSQARNVGTARSRKKHWLSYLP